MADFTTRFNELLTRTPDNGTALAHALCVSKQTISAWKNGVRFPKRPTISIIASYFGVGVPWLQGVTDDETAGIDYTTIKAALGSSSPAAKKLHDIGEQLNVHGLEYLFPDKPDVCELVSIYDSLNDLGRQTLMGTARGLAANPDMKKDGASNDVTA